MATQLTRRGARSLTEAIDKVASTVQKHHALLGLDPKIATEFAYRCDLISDAVETQAVSNFPKQAEFDAGTIAEEVPGPLEHLDNDEPWIDDHFTQQNFDELQNVYDEMGMKPFFTDTAKKAALGIANAKNASELTAAVKQLREILKKAELTTLPTMNRMQLEKQIDALVAVEKDIAQIKAEYDAIFKKLAGLEKEQKAGIEVLKKAAAQVNEKGKHVIDCKNAILEFQAKTHTSTPGLEQIMANPADVKEGERAGDLLGRILEKHNAEIAASVIEIIKQTKIDLTISSNTVAALKVVAKSASVPTNISREAGLFEVAVSLKEWLAGKVDPIAQKILGVAGDIKKWLSGFTERTKIVAKESDKLLKLISATSKEMDKVLKSASDSNEPFDLTQE